jgi:hypothetical protein
MADTPTPARARPPATLNRDDIAARLYNAELLRNGAYRDYVNTPCGPTDPVVRDQAGRTPEARYHYLCGVADAYAHMLTELDTRDRRS